MSDIVRFEATLTFTLVLASFFRLSRRDANLPRIDLHNVDLTSPAQVEEVFKSYDNKGGVWGVVHIAVRPELADLACLPPPVTLVASSIA